MRVLVNVVLEPQGRYRAWCPALPGCCVYGRSREHAVECLDEAIRGYIASLDVPVPQELRKEVRINAA